MKKHHRRRRVRRGTVLARFLRMFMALCGARFGLTLEEFRREAGCGRRTFYRYLASMKQAGIPIERLPRARERAPAWRVSRAEGRRIWLVA